ncbi:hypothetical protein PspR84_17245 [Pseudomonas sp. R84]|uniref:hypothetical protein n=1 Tax=Pseudomonas sp. R84 TaxID=1573712 RepID=UPI00131FE764|nr:hypothetical protein [Pseudomonas sp. R84]QHC96308.1 hypothetical protein PspR84_17245 [Pseudomonas sp. R84]
MKPEIDNKVITKGTDLFYEINQSLFLLGVIDKIKACDFPGAMPKAATRWAALPEGPGKKNHYPPQHYVEYPEFLSSYKSAGGTTK